MHFKQFDVKLISSTILINYLNVKEWLLLLLRLTEEELKLNSFLRQQIDDWNYSQHLTEIASFDSESAEQVKRVSYHYTIF